MDLSKLDDRVLKLIYLNEIMYQFEFDFITYDSLYYLLYNQIGISIQRSL